MASYLEIVHVREAISQVARVENVKESDNIRRVFVIVCFFYLVRDCGKSS